MQASSEKKHPLLKIIFIIIAALIVLSVAFGQFKKSMYLKAFKGGFIKSSLEFTSAYRYVASNGKTSYLLFESGGNAVCYIAPGSDYAWLSGLDNTWPSDDLYTVFYYPSNTYYMNFYFPSPSDDSVLTAYIVTDKSSYDPILYEETDIGLASSIFDNKIPVLLSQKD